MWLKHIFIQMDLSHVFLQNGIKKFNINQSFAQDILAECTAGFKNRLFLRLLRVISLSWNI